MCGQCTLKRAGVGTGYRPELAAELNLISDMDVSAPFTPPGSRAPYAIRAEVDVDLIQNDCNTGNFDVQGLLVIRRDTTLPIRLDTRSKLQRGSISATLVYEEGKHEVALQVVMEEFEHSSRTIQVAVPANTPVTMYMVKIKGLFEDGVPFDVELKDHVVVLFNAWSRNDTVYLEDESWRQEYVLNSKGRLYIGDRYGDAWNLGLYQEDTLRAVLFILETVSKMTFEHKRDPILVVREMSAVVNSEDENGVLVGRWADDFPDGQFPWSWVGSAAILKQYYHSGGQPVKYGQCWVFSGVLLTVLRVLGIPSRSVTNFNSAHDSNRNRTIDEYYDEDMNRLDYLSSSGDSVWNFHVWNETWMRRPDLPPGFDGWQVVDATPQEESPQGGGYKTGPAPIKAIKEGNSVGYDTNFVIAEVNADIKKFVIESDGTPRLYQVDTKTVGKKISTKAVGTQRRVDVTDQYKYPEGTDWERRALYNGYKELLVEVHDVEFFIQETEYEFGQDVTLVVTMSNKARQHRVRGKIQCQAVTYTGKTLEDVGASVVDVKVNKGRTEDTSMTVDGAIFSKHPNTKVYLKFVVGLAVQGTSQMFSETVMIAPNPPKLSITGPDELAVGEAGKLLIAFKNTLPTEMKDVTLNIDIDGLSTDDISENLGTIQPNAEMKYFLDITGVKLGSYTVVASLASDKVEHVTGEKEIDVVSTPPKNPVIPFDELDIKEVELNIESNRDAHFTSDYDYSGLVVRRGQSFSIGITTTKPMPTGSKVVTRAVFQLISKSVFNSVAFEVIAVSSVSGNSVDLVLKPPADVSIGEYRLLLTVDDAGMVSVLRQNITLAILFNPWCTDDSCHFPQTSDLREYVLNTKGRNLVGSAYNNYGRPWQLSQFSKDSLEVALWILDHLKGSERADPIKVSRLISALVNEADDNGILVGNWSGDYSGGRSPTDWTGSGAILAEFNRTKEPVKFGQCWVFSGVQTTLLRCLGMPARSITNFNSAHDTDFNRAIDKYYDEDGEPISGGDSIWNFHVWNEAWMSRPDLPTGFGGWQALDATPQEESPQGGGYRLGPASLRAIKLGQRMQYDVEFVISEVNADIRHYTVHRDGTKTLTRVENSVVGKNISTKAVESTRVRQDVTLDYKFREGSTSERAALLAETESEKLINVQLEAGNNVQIGQSFVVTAHVTNKAASERTLSTHLFGRAVLYTGAPGQMVRESRFVDSFNAGERKQYDLVVRDWDYLRILQGGNFINFTCMATDREYKTSSVKTDNFRLKTPDIEITVPKDGLKLYQQVEITASFINPLDRRLTNASFALMGDGFVQDATVNIPTVNPRNMAKATFKTTAMRKGSFELVVRFSSRELTDIMGDEDLEIV